MNVDDDPNRNVFVPKSQLSLSSDRHKSASRFCPLFLACSVRSCPTAPPPPRTEPNKSTRQKISTQLTKKRNVLEVAETKRRHGSDRTRSMQLPIDKIEIDVLLQAKCTCLALALCIEPTNLSIETTASSPSFAFLSPGYLALARWSLAALPVFCFPAKLKNGFEHPSRSIVVLQQRRQTQQPAILQSRTMYLFHRLPLPFV